MAGWTGPTENIVIGIDPFYNFMNYDDPANPVPLLLSVAEATLIVFSFTDALLNAGWSFQDEPFIVRKDYGVNFSSYGWIDNIFQGDLIPQSKFRVVFECLRLGEYEYTINMVDRHGQKITLDPKIENGTGW